MSRVACCRTVILEALKRGMPAIAMLAGLAGLAGLALGQPLGHSILVPFSHGSHLDAQTPGYDPATEKLTVTGFITLPAGSNASDYRALLQGQFVAMTPISPGPNPTQFQYSRTIPMGQNPPPNGWQYWAYSSYFQDEDHIIKPIVAELLLNATNEVVARHRIVLIDRRTDGGLNAKFGGDLISASLGVELTGAGLDRLEPLLASVQPQPSRSSFDATLTANFRNYNRTVQMNTDVANLPVFGNQSPKACVPLQDAPDSFKNTNEYGDILAEADYNFSMYAAAQQLQQTGAISGPLAILFPPGALVTILLTANAQTIINTSCVKAPPAARHFELCASSMRGDAQHLAMDGVAGIDLALASAAGQPSPPGIGAKNTLGRLNGEVDGTLKNLFYRYAENAVSVCTIRPKKDLAEATVAANTTMNAWRTCLGLELDALAPSHQTSIVYKINAEAGNASDPEKNRVDAYSTPVPLFDLGPNRVKNPDKGTCAAAGFRRNALDLLEQFWSRARSALDTSWNAGSPQTQQANGLDLILSRWETGIYGDANLAGTLTGADHQMTHRYDPLASANMTDRLYTRMNTQAKLLNGASPVSWVYSEPGPPPCSPGQSMCGTNRTFFNQSFDMSYMVTTGALNQVVKELSAGSLLTFNFQPTYGQLGATPPAGVPATAIAVLNGPTLAQVHGNLAELGPNVATLRITPTIVPFTYMNPDPSGTNYPAPEGRVHLTYQLAQLKMEVVTDPVAAPGPFGDGVWLTSAIDFYDPELDMSPATVKSTNRLTPTYSGRQSSTVTVLRNGFFSCPMGAVVPPPPSNPPVPYPNCANTMANSLFDAFRPTLLDRLLYMVSRFPAPLLMDAAGQAPTPLEFQPVDKYQWRQIINFYGNLR